jgi:hypothetical protein
MGLEGPILSAVVARLAYPEINLAAWGGIVNPLALIIESPIIMLLAASTALSKDWASFQKIYKFMMIAGAALTGLHILIAFTPLYDVIVIQILGVPAEIVEPGRIGIQLMLPWTWAIAYRRYHQGVMIRFNHSRLVGVGTLVRLSALVLVLGIGYWVGDFAGIAVGSAAVAFAVTSESLYIGRVVQPILRTELRPAPMVPELLTWKIFFAFYIPLALTSLIQLIVNPITSAAISRMNLAIESLAVWPVVMGLIFILRSLGVAYNEVMVALLDEPFSFPNLRKFALWLGSLTSLGLLILAATPLSTFWFQKISALNLPLANMARTALWLSIPLPALSVAQSYFQGIILHSKRTRGITESVAIYLLASTILLVAGVLWNQAAGLYIGLVVIDISSLFNTVWLWWRSQYWRTHLAERDREVPGLTTPATTRAS